MSLSLTEKQADKLIAQWAAKKAAAESRTVADVMREAGILDRRMERVVREREIPLSYFDGREEQAD